MSRSSRESGTLDRIFGAAFAAGLLWVPFWQGGAWRLAWGVNALIFPGLALGYEIARVARGREPPLPAREIAAPLAMFSAVLVWIALQQASTIWSPAIPGMGAWTPRTISVNPSASAMAATRLITDASAFWLAVQLGCDRALSRWLPRAVAAIVALYCAYGLFLASSYDNAIPGFSPPDGGYEVRSTFINRNNFAAFAGLGLMTVLALLADGRRAIGSSRLARSLERLGERAAPIAAGLVISAALLGSASRGGILAAAFGSLVILAMVALRRRRRGESFGGLAVLGVTLSAALLLHGGRLVARFAESGFSDAERLPVYRIVMHALAERPFLGFGYGAFADVFPYYRDATLSPMGVWEMAHDSYLETALGLGLVFAALLTSALALLAARCFSGALRHDRNSAAPLAGAGGAALIAADAVVDYSLELEAVALIFATLLGLGVAQSRVLGGRRC